MQDLDNNDNLNQVLYFPWTEDDNITKHFQGQVRQKYTNHDTQNELLHIMASIVLRVKVSTIRERDFFLITADERTDVSNIE